MAFVTEKEKKKFTCHVMSCFGVSLGVNVALLVRSQKPETFLRFYHFASSPQLYHYFNVYFLVINKVLKFKTGN